MDHMQPLPPCRKHAVTLVSPCGSALKDAGSLGSDRLLFTLFGGLLGGGTQQDAESDKK